MAKLLTQPVFFLVVGWLALAAADPHLGLDSGDKTKGLFSFGQKHEEDDKNKITLSFGHKKETDDDKNKITFSFGSKKESDDQAEVPTDADGNPCKCENTQVKEFFDKFILLFRAYGSKELAPEIRSIAVKIADFIMGYLAKEKPDEMGKFHNFLQSSVKVTSEAVNKNSINRAKRHFGSFK